MVPRVALFGILLVLFSSCPAQAEWFCDLDTDGMLDDSHVDWVQTGQWIPVPIDVWIFGDQPIREFRLNLVHLYPSTGAYEGCTYHSPDGWDDVAPVPGDTVVLSSSIPSVFTGMPPGRLPSWSGVKALFHDRSESAPKVADCPPLIVPPYRVATVEYYAFDSSVTEIFLASGFWVSAEGDTNEIPGNGWSDRIVALSTLSLP